MKNLRNELDEILRESNYFVICGADLDWLENTDVEAKIEVAEAFNASDIVEELSDEEASECVSELLDEKEKLPNEDKCNAHIYRAIELNKTQTYVLLF